MAKKNKNVISKQQLVDDIINSAKKAKSIPTRSQYRRFGKHASATIENRMGSWSVVAKKLKATQFVWSK
jgi:hypothetical protein